MRTRSSVLMTAALLCMSACGGGNSRTPVAPSAGISVLPGAAPRSDANASATVSWQCFTGSLAPNSFAPAGCSSRATTSRLLLPAATGAPITAPNAPSNLTATVAGAIVTLNWTAPVGGDPLTSYQIQAGTAPGLTNIASFDTASTATSLAIFNVSAGTYFVRVRAINSAGGGAASNEVQVVVGGAPPCATLSAPTALAATINGATVVLSWAAPSGCSPASYIIQAGSAPGASNLANFSTGSTATSFTATGVGQGTYFVRVLSESGAVQSAPSTEVVFVVGTCGTAPPPPTNLQFTVNGSTVVFTWLAPSGGCAPASYLLQAGSSPGASNLANSPVNGTTLTATGVANGTYYVRVVAVNAVGQSTPSNEVVVTLPPGSAALVVGFQFFDPASQAGPTTVCRITSAFNSTCELRSTSFALGTNTIVSYAWTVQYTYGTVKTIAPVTSQPQLSITETCGGPGSSAEGADQPLSVTLTVTDNLGNQATATAGSGSQPPLFLRLFTC
jgi:fibronectin type III domain protein